MVWVRNRKIQERSEHSCSRPLASQHHEGDLYRCDDCRTLWVIEDYSTAFGADRSVWCRASRFTQLRYADNGDNEHAYRHRKLAMEELTDHPICAIERSYPDVHMVGKIAVGILLSFLCQLILDTYGIQYMAVILNITTISGLASYLFRD